MLSIGKLFKNLKKIIIDENGNILPNEKKGELCISGDQVSPGYWNDTTKIIHPFLKQVLRVSTEDFIKQEIYVQ